MTEPVTAIDRRYSDPNAEAVEWSTTVEALEVAELFWIATVRADGRPHDTPVVAAWSNEALWFASGAEEQKVLNMTANSHVVATTGCNGWDSGLDVVIEGDAQRVTDDTVLTEVATAFHAKWDGRWDYTARDGWFRGSDGSGEALVFKVTPTKVLAHAKGDPFGATTHRFPREQ